MKHYLILYFILSIVLHGNDVTYEELLNSASVNSFKLKLLKSDENIESSKLESVYADYYPTLNLSYNTEYNRDLNGFSTGTESVGDTVITNGTRYQSDSSDYGFLSEDTITFDSANQQFVITLDIFGDETSTCREFKIANNISTCKLHVEQIQHNKEVA